ncbi:putative methyltransferase DDB_G0268948 [Mixophyes fleayi]|uniref:putative methyltransferase DDB_G0268948 n=1 Tax=Mixophyes fleayi TaxID=3061075 RepID=UPI003F4DB265
MPEQDGSVNLYCETLQKQVSLMERIAGIPILRMGGDLSYEKAESESKWKTVQMEVELFNSEEYAKIYHEHMCPASKNVLKAVLSYLEEKKGKPFELVVDAGCGTGRSTRPLAEFFSKVIGIDISESQIIEAKRSTPQENVTYQVALVEKMPLEDASVDLISSDIAAQWFPVDKFVQEVARVLKNRGCVALHSYIPKFSIQYKNFSETLTNIYTEAMDSMYTSEHEVCNIMKSEFQEIFDALPFADKKRISGIAEMFHMRLAELLGFIKALPMYHTFLTKDRDGAIAFLQTLEKKMADVIGEQCVQENLEVHFTYFCVLACKS